MLNALENKRVNAFVENLLNYQEQGRGVISIIGQSHYQNLVKKFEENQVLSEVKFFHIFTPDILANVCADMYIDLEDNQLTTYVDRAVRNEQDMLRFLTEFKNIMEEIFENSYQKLPIATASTECLNRLSSLHFDSYCRPSFFVDCLSRINTAEDLTSAQTILTTGIKGNLTFFDHQLHFCVPNVNKTDVAQHLQKLTK